MRTLVLLAVCLLAVRTAACQQTAQTTPTTISMEVLKAHVAKFVKPTYPPIAKAARVGGIVTVGVQLDPAGRVVQTSILNGPELLRQSSIDAVQKCQFRPVEVNGAPAFVFSAVQLKYYALTGIVTY